MGGLISKRRAAAAKNSSASETVEPTKGSAGPPTGNSFINVRVSIIPRPDEKTVKFLKAAHSDPFAQPWSKEFSHQQQSYHYPFLPPLIVETGNDDKFSSACSNFFHWWKIAQTRTFPVEGENPGNSQEILGHSIEKEKIPSAALTGFPLLNSSSSSSSLFLLFDLPQIRCLQMNLHTLFLRFYTGPLRKTHYQIPVIELKTTTYYSSQEEADEEMALYLPNIYRAIEILQGALQGNPGVKRVLIVERLLIDHPENSRDQPVPSRGFQLEWHRIDSLPKSLSPSNFEFSDQRRTDSCLCPGCKDLLLYQTRANRLILYKNIQEVCSDFLSDSNIGLIIVDYCLETAVNLSQPDLLACQPSPWAILMTWWKIDEEENQEICMPFLIEPTGTIDILCPNRPIYSK